MKLSMKRGFSFGLISGIITTLGLIVGLNSGTHSKLVVFGGILTIAVADAFSDALGIHISQEAAGKNTTKEIWESTFATFLSKFVFAATFIVPVVFLDLSTAIIASIAWGLLLLGFFSYVIARKEKTKPWKVIGEHIAIAVLVIIITHFVGDFVASVFA